MAGFEGRVALVTGGSRGIGAAVARTLAARGEPARALVHSGELANLLPRELGARPARETREIAERLRG